jgi:hypothetical protein
MLHDHCRFLSGIATGIFLWLAAGGPAEAQTFSFSPQYEPEVLRGGDPLANPWNGGFNSAQFWPCDLDNDGEDDLIMYDKAARKVLTWMARPQGSGWRWKYQAEFEDIVPPVESWIATADFNCDGKWDLFTQTSAGIRVYRNAGGTADMAAFVLETDGLTSQGFNGMVNIQVNPYGAPAFSDVDGDGDLDVIAFDFNGSTAEYHRNRVMENSGTCQGFDLKKDSCVFGRFATKPACGQIRLNTGCLGQSPPPTGEEPAGPLRVAHLGSQLAVYDLDGDGDKDLLVGDLGCPLLNRLINGGTPQSALITQADTLFPSTSQYVRLANFPSAYFADFDFDGRRDMVVTPTYFGNFSDDYANQTRSCTRLYRNLSNGPVPDFQLTENDFLQNQGIETGEESVPLLADLDSDGDLDLLVGHTGEKSGGMLRATLWLYRNTGTPQQARFVAESNDFLGLSAGNFSRIRPLVFDFNRDGKTDFGWLSTTGSFPFDSTRLRILYNSAAPGGPMVLPPWTEAQLFPFSFSRYDCPVFTEISGDSRPDMLLARYAGRMQYWRATQDWPAPSLVLQNANYGNLARAPFATNPAAALADMDQNGQPDLLVGDFTGSLKAYRDFLLQDPSSFTPDSTLFYNPLFSENVYHKWGNFISPALGDLNGDGFPELAVGQAGGGLNLLVNRLGPNAVSERSNRPGLRVFPNPSESFRTFRVIGMASGGELEVQDIRGAFKGRLQSENGVFHIPSSWAPGWYFLHSGAATGKIWVR